VGELVRDDLARIGIRLTVRSLADPLAHARAHPGRFDLLFTGTSAKYPDPVGFLRRALHGNGGSRASALLRHAARLDGTRRAAAIGAADVGLMRAVVPVAPLATDAAPELFGARVGCRIAQPVYFGVDLAAMCIRHRE
jgi:ABC-type oligopeptide transport system substrate-binding subunit